MKVYGNDYIYLMKPLFLLIINLSNTNILCHFKYEIAIKKLIGILTISILISC